MAGIREIKGEVLTPRNATKDLLDRRTHLKQNEANYRHFTEQVRQEYQGLDKQVGEIYKKAVNVAENC